MVKGGAEMRPTVVKRGTERRPTMYTIETNNNTQCAYLPSLLYQLGIWPIMCIKVACAAMQANGMCVIGGGSAKFVACVEIGIT